MSIENPGFLKERYGLHNAEEVDVAAERTEMRTGETVPQDPASRIQNYLDRLERLALDPDKEQSRKMFDGESRPRALLLLREMVMSKYVRPNKGKLAAGAARVEERAAREMGIEAHYGEQELDERGDIAVVDLEKSLDNWISYLSDQNEPYPVWFRYYAFRSVLDLGDYDKDTGEFTKRSQGSTRLFPDIDRGALAYVEQMIEAAKDPVMLKKLQEAQRAAANNDVPSSELLTPAKVEQFATFSFAKQYAEGIKQAGEITPEMRALTTGKWVKYGQGTEPTALWASLQNKGTAWCTKGFATAEKQLEGGDFYVYYSDDKQGKPTIPRIAIRMQEGKIGEVRGVADNQQNLEGNMAPIAEEKMSDLPGAEEYKKKTADMKALTAIEQATKANQPLNAKQLRFLYEIDSRIEHFGYERDPRIAELRSTRNPQEDMPTVFECSSAEIAHSASDITADTKAYVGPLVPGIFQMLPEGIEHIYTSFPENPIRQDTVEIGGMSREELIRELEAKKINISPYAEDMLNSADFTTSKETEAANLVRLTVESLGFPRGATTDEIYRKAEELGLELCPAEVGPQYRLKYGDQPMGDFFIIGMKQITGRHGYPRVFGLHRNEDGPWLTYGDAEPGRGWDPDYKFAFRLPATRRGAGRS